MPVPTRKKYLSEARTLTFDFTDKLAVGDSLTGSPTVTNDTGITISGTSRSGSLVSLKVSGGQLNVDYRIRVSCATGAGDTVELDVIVKITNDAN